MNNDSQTQTNWENNKEIWYKKTKEHWENSESSVNGVLGGNDRTHHIDIKASCELLESLFKKGFLSTDNTSKTKSVLDCGAGIGRVTSHVLVNYFDECDLVEQDEKFANYCRQNLKNEKNVRNVYQCSLQDFKPEIEYNMIWAQWCLENLDDDDLEVFMVKCSKNLAPSGLVVVKENIVDRGTKFISHDYSRTRSDIIFKSIFEKSGFKIIRHFHHPNWPNNMMKVSIFVLKVNV